jgi:hypothetical protein
MNVQVIRGFTSACGGFLTIDSIINLLHAKNNIEKFFFLVCVLFFFFVCIYWLCTIIEDTEWYQNIQRGRDLLLAKEEEGAEPDPKSFELP